MTAGGETSTIVGPEGTNPEKEDRQTQAVTEIKAKAGRAHDLHGKGGRKTRRFARA